MIVHNEEIILKYILHIFVVMFLWENAINNTK